MEEYQKALTPEEKEKGDLYFHPGWDIRLLKPSDTVKASESEADIVKGMAGAWYQEESESGKWYPQKMLLLSTQAGPETVAHELGHISLGHLEEEEDSTVETFIRHEVEAWSWAEDKRGKSLKTRWIPIVLTSATDAYPEASPERLHKALVSSLRRVGITPKKGFAAIVKRSVKELRGEA